MRLQKMKYGNRTVVCAIDFNSEFTVCGMDVCGGHKKSDAVKIGKEFNGVLSNITCVHCNEIINWFDNLLTKG